MVVAVITPVAGRHQHLINQRAGLRAGDTAPAFHTVVSMGDSQIPAVLADDSGPDAGVVAIVNVHCDADHLPLARARNAGATHAIAHGADVLVFLDVDCIPGPSTIRRYLECCERDRGALFCGPVAYLPPSGSAGYDLEALHHIGVPHPARPVPAADEVLTKGDPHLFWSLSFALHADAWRRIGGFCETYEGYGAEDTDFAQVATSKNIPVNWTGDAWAYHQFHATSRPPAQHLDDIVRNAGIFHSRWGWWPMRGWLSQFEALGLARYDVATDRWTAVVPQRSSGTEGVR
jgi:hypothetical protein